MQKLFELGTTHGTRVIIDKANYNLAHINEDKITISHARAYLYIPDKNNKRCYIMADIHDAERFSCTGYAGTFSAIPFDRSSGITPRSISLADTWRGQFLTALLPTEEGRVEVSRNDVAEWESFVLIDVDCPPKNVEIRCGKLLLGHTKNHFSTAETFLEMLSNGQLDSDMTESLGRLMPFDECWRLLAELDARPELEDALAIANPLDRWATEALPALGAWLRNSRSPGPAVRTVSADFDFLEYAEVHGKIWSFPMLLNGLRRQAVRPTRQACILATARNEGIYFVEWLAHHRALGFEDFFIYTNNNTDGSEQLFEILAAEGIIHLTYNEVGPSTGPQYKAYGHALQFTPEILDYKWVAIVDIDEFIQINSDHFSSIIDFLNWFDLLGTDSVGLSWRNYGPNKNVLWKDLPLTTRFTKPDRRPNDHLKSIFKTHKFLGSHCHYPYALKYNSNVYRYSNGIKIEEGPFYNRHSYESAWINHFYIKSFEELAVRKSRNLADRPVESEMNSDRLSNDLVNIFLHTYDMESDDGEEDYHFDQKRLAEIEKIMGLPGISAAVDRCKAAFRIEVEHMKSILVESPRFQTPGKREKWLLECLLSEP